MNTITTDEYGSAGAEKLPGIPMLEPASQRARVRSERKTAIAVGVLYVAATVAGALASSAIGPVLAGPDALIGLAAHKTQVLAAAFFELLLAVTVAGIAFMLYPVLKRDADTPSKEGLALWYVGTRITEGAIFLTGIVGLLSLFALSEEIANAAAADPVQYRAMGAVLRTASDYSWILGQSVFCVGAAMLSYLLYVSRRVPRWSSLWGLIAAPLMLVAGFLLPVTGDTNSTASIVLYAPLAVQEMVLAVWLILRGFNPPLPHRGLPARQVVTAAAVLATKPSREG